MRHLLKTIICLLFFTGAYAEDTTQTQKGPWDKYKKTQESTAKNWKSRAIPAESDPGADSRETIAATKAKNQCEKKSGKACLKYADILAKEKNYDDAEVYFKRACDLQNIDGCLVASRFEKINEEYRMKLQLLMNMAVLEEVKAQQQTNCTSTPKYDSSGRYVSTETDCN